MAFALSKVQWLGLEVDEPLQKRFRQQLVLDMTGLNTDVDLDIGDYSSGTFWTAVGTSSAKASALLLGLQKMQAEAKAFQGVAGTGLNGRVQLDSTYPSITSFLSTATSSGGTATKTLTVTGLASTDTVLSVDQVTAGVGVHAGIGITKLTGTVATGSATPTAAVTGLVTTDTIVNVTQQTPNANSLPLIGHANTCAVNAQLGLTYSADTGGSGTINIGVLRDTAEVFVPISWGTVADNALDVTWSGVPGASAVVKVTVQRNVGTVQAGTYELTMDATHTKIPNLLFLSTDAPTTYSLTFTWDLNDGVVPMQHTAS